MKVKLTIISRDQLDVIRPLAEKLRNAIDAGDGDAMDATTEALLAIVEGGNSIDLAEDTWREWISEIRRKLPEFESDYVISGDLCNQFFPDATSDTIVLQIPYSG